MKNYWDKTFFLSDEAHSLGSGHLRTCLPVETPVRLALSATIDRYFDDTGTAALKTFFKDVITGNGFFDTGAQYNTALIHCFN